MRISIEQLGQGGLTREIPKLDALITLLHQKIRSLKLTLPCDASLTVVCCDTLSSESLQAIVFQHNSTPVYVAPINEEVTPERALTELERALRFFAPNVFTPDVRHTLRDHVERHDYTFEANLMRAKNKNETIRANLIVTIREDKARVSLDLYDIHGKRRWMKREAVIEVDASSFDRSFPRGYRISRQVYKLHWDSLYTLDVIGWLGDRYRFRVYPKQDGKWCVTGQTLERKRLERSGLDRLEGERT
ncbi:hypothetical protein [Exiguobacterium sp.]|uniref:hypothetical protein n=2 Tax=Exiguobacterium sp. TaxID=44751 RepID=UPI00263AC973|nr:hypothetical protein [Exiguobacterium sp.]MCC5892021.1 hypothetical protein [Exiguobacterium sp.]